jgi:hypothetical protein
MLKKRSTTIDHTTLSGVEFVVYEMYATLGSIGIVLPPSIGDVDFFWIRVRVRVRVRVKVRVFCLLLTIKENEFVKTPFVCELCGG